jgi:hypothetical protein
MGTWKAVADALVKFYHESPRFMAVMCAVCAVLLFLPARYLAPLGVESLVLRYHPYIGGLFLIFAGMTVSYPVQYGWEWGRQNIKERSYRKAMTERLSRLDLRETEILKDYISQNLRSRYFYFNDAAVANLRRCRILHYSSHPWYDVRQRTSSARCE